jgi:hypothetical protein
MNRSTMTVEKWVQLFEELGLSKEQMHRWHTLFETKYPEEHQQFLEWLNLSSERIKEVRAPGDA